MLLKRLDVLPVTLDILIDILSKISMNHSLRFNVVMLLVAIIPIYVLWKVRIRIHQKLGLGVFLCLNTFMSIMALIRVTGLDLHLGEPYDVNWIDFWLEIEACVGVTMVSITAFRSIFVINASKANHERAARPWFSSTVERLRARKIEDLEDPDMRHLPKIPSVRMTNDKEISEVNCGSSFEQEPSFRKQQMHNNTSYCSDLPEEPKQSHSTTLSETL